MGLIYSSAESEAMIQALKNNINISNQIVDKLTRGCRHLVDVLETGQLSGAAYTAGKGLIEEIIIPAIYKVQEANKDVQADLSSYEYAHSIVAEYGLLNHDDLQKKLSIKNEQVDEINKQLERNNNFFNLIQETVTGDLGNMLAQNQALEYMRDQILEPQIQEIKTKMDKLEWFVSAVNGLFRDSLEAFQLAVQGAKSINQISVDSFGNYYTNGADMGWLQKLQGESFDNGAGGLSDKYKNDSNAFKEIMDLAKSMGISPLNAEELYQALQKYGKSKKELDELNKSMELIQAEYGGVQNVPDEYKEKLRKDGEAYVFKWDGKLGSIEFGKAVSEQNLIDGSFDLISPKEKTYGHKAIGDNVHTGPSFGGSATWLELSPKFWGITPNIDLVTGKLGGYTDIKNADKGDINIGGNAEVAAAKGEIPITLKIPFIGMKANVTFEGSVLSAGVGGHVNINSKQNEFSIGGKAAFGAGGGINITLSEDKEKK